MRKRTASAKSWLKRSNKADQLIYTAEKTIKDLGDKVDPGGNRESERSQGEGEEGA